MEYSGPSACAPPKTERAGKRKEEVAPETPGHDDFEDEDLAWYDDVVAMLTPRSGQARSREVSPSGSPRENEKADEGVGQGFLGGMLGSITSSFGTVGDVMGTMKFWEGDGSKSPRHHFQEGEIFKGMFSSEHESPINSTTMGGPSGNANAASSSRSSSGVASCMRVEGAPPSKPGLHIRFEVVEWRNHEVLMDGSGGLPSAGTPLGIGWKVESERWATIDDFEASREALRRPRDVFMMDGFVTPKQRAALFYELGCTKEEVSASELATFKNNRRRKASVADLSDMV